MFGNTVNPHILHNLTLDVFNLSFASLQEFPQFFNNIY